MAHGEPVEFRILGPLEVQAGSSRLDLGGVRQQTVLAMLLLSAGHVVTMDRLLRAVHGEDLPPTSRSQAQISISALRRVLAAHGGAGIVSTREQGYVLQAGNAGVEAGIDQEGPSDGQDPDIDAGGRPGGHIETI
jgi:DNA-binding response OmpR family regulator